MALTQLTKIDGRGINTTSDYRVGILTAVKFVGPFDGTGGNFAGVVTATDGVFSGNVTIGGTLTYEDVTNIDSVGIITARDGIDCNGDIDVDGHTNLDNVSVSGVTTFTGGIDANSTLEVAGVANFDSTIQLADTIEHLGDSNTKIRFPTDDNISFEAGATGEVARFLPTNASSGGPRMGLGTNNPTGMLHIYGANPPFRIQNSNDSANLQMGMWDASNIMFQASNRTFKFATETTNDITFFTGGLAGSYERLRITSGGTVNIGGNYSHTGSKLQVTGNSTFTGNIDANGDLDVDGHTNLDNVSIAGITTVNGGFIFDNGTNAGKDLQWQPSNNRLAFFNDVKATFGNTVDLQIYHNSTENHIYGSTNKPLIFSTNTNERLHIKSDGKVLITNTLGLGGATSNPGDLLHAQSPSGEGKIVIIGATTGTVAISGLNGASRVLFGDSSTENAGNITYTHSSDTLSFRVNGNTRWKFDSSGHFLPDAVGSYNIGSTDAEIGNVYIADNKRFYAGSDQNLSLHHNSSTGINYLVSNPGNMFYMSATNYFTDAAQSKIQAQFIHNSYCELRHAGNLKFRTSETGIDVTGEVKATQDYPNFRPTVDFNFAATKKLDPRITYYRTGPASYHDEFGKVVIVGDNVPRFDHTFPEYWDEGNLGDSNSRGISKGLLMEPTRTNIYKNNHNLTTANDHGSITQTVNTTETTAPDGTLTATKIAVTGGDQWTRWDSNNGLEISQVNFTDTFSTSIYMKTVGTSNVNVVMDFGDNGGKTFSVGQEWKRYAISNVHVNYGGSTKFIDIVFNGNVYIWGLQCENGTHPTSYIPTSGTTATRGNEHAVIDGEDFTDFYNPVESSVLAVGTIHRPIAAQGQLNILHIGDDNEDGHGIFREHGTKDVWYHIRNGNSTPSGGNLNPSGFGDWNENEEARIAIAFKDGDQAISVNGGNQVTATVTSNYPTANITKMWIGSHGNGSYFEGHIKRISYYPKQLTDNQLNTLTA